MPRRPSRGLSSPSWRRITRQSATRSSSSTTGPRIGLRRSPRASRPVCRPSGRRAAVETFAACLVDQERAMRVYRPPSVVTANLIVRRALFDTIGLFDESLRRGQDVDLAYRAHFRHGATFAYAERAVVAHVNPR